MLIVLILPYVIVWYNDMQQANNKNRDIKLYNGKKNYNPLQQIVTLSTYRP